MRTELTGENDLVLLPTAIHAGTPMVRAALLIREDARTRGERHRFLQQRILHLLHPALKFPPQFEALRREIEALLPPLEQAPA